MLSASPDELFKLSKMTFSPKNHSIIIVKPCRYQNDLYKGSRQKSSFISDPATKASSPPPPTRLSGHRNFFP